jgi:outer membrane protein OmpA-like peptidoglycan-associated protein
MHSHESPSPRARLIQQRMTRLNELSPPLRACIVADIKRNAQRAARLTQPNHKADKATCSQRLVSTWALAAITLLSSCGTPHPPAPPNVDEAAKRPANDPLEVQNRRARIQSHNERLLQQVREQRAQLQAKSIPVAFDDAPQPANEAARPPEARANHVYIVTFAYGKTEPEMSEDQQRKLLADAKAAEYILVRGRTDGKADLAGEAKTARDRAARMKALLVAGGTDPRRIRVTHQPSGDHLASNSSEPGRTLNRRVEVELYAARPSVHVFEARTKSST